MFEVTIREILPDGSRVPVVRDGKELPVLEIDGLALLAVEKDYGSCIEAFTTLLNISERDIESILADCNCKPLTLGVLRAYNRLLKAATAKEAEQDAAE